VSDAAFATPVEAAPRAARGARALASALVWPTFVSALSATLAACAARGQGELALLAVAPAFALLLVLLERLLPDRPQAPLWRDPQIGNDVGHGIVGQGLAIPLGELVVGALALVAGKLVGASALAIWPSHWPLALQALALVAVADGLEYARHRALHTVPWLWRLHVLHHAVDRLHVAKASRTHLLDMLMRSATVYAPFVILGAPPEVLVWYPIAVTILGPIAHANVAVRLPAWLHPLLMTPQVHRLHHARPLALSRSNYANVFPLWDVLCGTFCAPGRHAHFEYGIEPDPHPRAFAAQLLWPLRRRSGTHGR
jgi:sterol desaturase/sphingolipid hydroxylase (fatty acid hydroxylase superfamily)